MTELPHKTAYYGALLALLSAHADRSAPKPAPLVTKTAGDSIVHIDAAAEAKPEADEKTAEAPPKLDISRQIIQHLCRRFESYLEQRKWTALRQSVLFFTYLATLEVPLVKLSSLLKLLGACADVINEPGVKLVRSDECVRIVGESLLRLPADVGSELRLKLSTYLQERSLDKDGILMLNTNDDVRALSIDRICY